MFKFITHKPFWVNLLAAGILGLLIIFGVLMMLGKITRHGEYLVVPEVVGKSTEEAVKFLESKGFDVLIQDSVYVDTAQKGTVLKQLPDPNSTVKVNRTVFLTVNRLTLPLVDVPDLVGKTLGYALVILDRNHLKLGDTTSRPDFMKGSVLEQSFNGRAIEPGSKIPYGSAISLVIAGGLSEEKFPVPDLVNMTLSEARPILDSNQITIGAIIPDPDVTDTSAAFIWKQDPPRYNASKELMFMKAGQIMDLFLSKERKADTLIINP